MAGDVENLTEAKSPAGKTDMDAGAPKCNGHLGDALGGCLVTVGGCPTGRGV